MTQAEHMRICTEIVERAVPFIGVSMVDVEAFLESTMSTYTNGDNMKDASTPRDPEKEARKQMPSSPTDCLVRTSLAMDKLKKDYDGPDFVYLEAQAAKREAASKTTDCRCYEGTLEYGQHKPNCHASYAEAAQLLLRVRDWANGTSAMDGEEYERQLLEDIRLFLVR